MYKLLWCPKRACVLLLSNVVFTSFERILRTTRNICGNFFSLYKFAIFKSISRLVIFIEFQIILILKVKTVDMQCI